MSVLYSRMVDDVVDHITKALKEARQPKVPCERYIGRFGEDDVKRLSNRCPRVLISLLGIDPVELSDTHVLVFSAAVLTRITSGNQHGEDTLNMLNILIHAVTEIDMDWARGVEDVQARSLYSGKLGENTANLWAIGWRINVPAMDSDGAKVFQNLPPFETYDGTTGVGGLEVKHAGTL